MHFKFNINMEIHNTPYSTNFDKGEFDVLQLDSENLSYQNFQHLQVHGEIQ